MSDMSKKKRIEEPREEGLLELLGMEKPEEAAQARKLGEAWLCPRLTWEQTLGLVPVKGIAT